MENLTKHDKRQLTALVKKGNLARCEEWLQEMRAMLDKPYDGEENSFDRCMEITKASRNFFKETMRREDCYRNSMLTIGVANLFREGYITKEDIESLSNEELRNRLLFIAEQ